MMVLLWRRVPLFPVILGGALLMAVLYHTPPIDLLTTVWEATKSQTTLQLEIILLLIMIFEHLLGEYGYLDRMLAGLQSVIRDRRAVMALLPAFIGLMPSAGGALFSAPLVGRATDGTTIAAEDKSFANFYYRHIWEFFLPLYPGVLLTSKLSGIPISRLILALMPYGVLMILLGLPALMRIPVMREEKVPAAGKQGRAMDLLVSVLPVLVVVLLVLLFGVDVSWAVGIVLVFLLIRHRCTPRRLWHFSREAVKVSTLLLVWGIMVFKEVLVATGAVDALPPLLARLPVPEFAVFGLITFLLGVLTGIVSGYVGIAFPLAIAAHDGGISLPLVVFMYVAGMVGNMLTPMHLCLVLTVDFFKADLQKVIKKVAGPVTALLAVAVVVFLVVR
ncbi:hypothetical protein SY88_05025 [Clostridiales bacterium PH28_bin88]|nr:hypothetical protein SY88_05025 [Clostridiales bacterium PH28_bin88]